MRMGLVIGACVVHAHQQGAFRLAQVHSLPSTEVVVLFNGTDVQNLPDQVEAIHVPERLNQPCGLWSQIFDLATERQWTWCAILHDDFWMLEPGWEEKLQEANRLYRVGMGVWCGFTGFDGQGRESCADGLASFHNQDNGSRQYNEGLAVTPDSMGLVFNMALFGPRGRFCDVPDNGTGYGYGEIEAALWTLQQRWVLWHLNLAWQHYNGAHDGVVDTYDPATGCRRWDAVPADQRGPATRAQLRGGGGADEARAPYGDLLPVRVVDSDTIDLNGRLVNMKRMTFDEMNSHLTPHGPILSIMNDTERRYIWECIQAQEGHPVIEIGSCAGGTTLLMSAAGAHPVWSVDNWCGGSGRFEANLATLPQLAAQIRTCVAPSATVADLFADGSCGVVLIDGDHGGDAPYRDLLLYAPKVRIGGWLLVDDVNEKQPPILEAVRRWEGEHGGAFELDRVCPQDDESTTTLTADEWPHGPWNKLMGFRRVR